jgi:D-3-phosphoglycerate dehydrogenase
LAYRILVLSKSFGAGQGRREKALQKIREAGHEVSAARIDEIPTTCDGFDAAIVGTDKIGGAFLEKVPGIASVVKFGVGVDNIDISECTKRGVLVGRLPGLNTEAVAEFALAMILSCARMIPRYDASMKARSWERTIGYPIHGRTLGIIGTGAIGRTLARFCSGLNMRILGYDSFPSAEFVQECGGCYVPLEDLLRTADFVSVHVPLTDGTRGMIRAPQLDLMKPTAFLINTARGGIVDERDLLDALERGSIAGAGLDVFEHEPPDFDGLVGHPRVVASPHVGAYTLDTLEAMEDCAIRTAVNLIQGVEITSAVNPEALEYRRGQSCS